MSKKVLVVELKLVQLVVPLVRLTLMVEVFAALWVARREGLFVLLRMILVVLLVLPRLHLASAPLFVLLLGFGGCVVVRLGWLVAYLVFWHLEAGAWFHLYTAGLLREFLVRVGLSWRQAAFLQEEGGENLVEEALVGGLNLS